MNIPRVIHIVSAMDRAGLETALMNYYRNIDRKQLQFDFLVSKTYHAEYDDEIKKLGGKIYCIPMSNPIKYLIEIFRFFREHKEYRVCHLHHLPWGALTLIAAKSGGIKNRICHVHYSKDRSRFLVVKDIMKKIAKKFSTWYFACSKFAGRNFYGNKIVFNQNFKMLPNAIALERFTYNPVIRNIKRKELGITDNTILLGQVSRLETVKNPLFTIEVLSHLKTHLPEVRCLFVGDGSLRPHLKAFAEEKGVFELCTFIGTVENPEDYMQAMDVLIFPSLIEGLGMVAIEAQASGLPCIASTGVPEECNVANLVSFIPLESGAEKWAKAVLNLIGKERTSRVEDVGKSGYDIHTEAINLQNFYLELIKEE